MSTIFSKIIAGEIPATRVYEDEKVLAFLDIHPVHKGHTLLIPKEEHEWFEDVPSDTLCHLMERAQELSRAMKKGLTADFVQLSVVGIDVPHFHLHLIPRYFDDGLESWPTKEYSDHEEKEAFAQKIKDNLPT